MYPGETMKNLTLFILLFAIVFCGFIPAVSAAYPLSAPPSGFITVINPPVADFFTNTQSGTAPLLVSFSDRSRGSLPMTYFWEFGDGSTSTDQNPTHAYNHNGNYTVSLTVTNRFGTNIKTVPAFVSVGDTPAASFYAAPLQGTLPLTVTFTDTSGAGVTSWHWDFGDSSNATLRNPVHTYVKSGTFSVSLDTTNRFGNGHIRKSALITTGVIPATEFFADVRQGDPPLTVSFHDYSSGNPTKWLWQFGDGGTSIEKDPVHTYRQTGYYNTTLTVSNAFGTDTLTRPNHIRVGTPTVPSSPVTNPVNVSEVVTRPAGIVGLIHEARGTTEKNLPTRGFIPPEFLALAALLTSLAVVLIQVVVANISSITQFLPKVAKFLIDLAGGHAVEKISEKEIEKRGIAVQQRERHFFGLSASEVLIIEIAVIMVALAFILADRVDLTLQTVIIYILVGAISVVLHDFAHRYFATKHGHDADTQFWGLGTVIMFLTAWLYGNAFAQSYRNLVQREKEDEPREMGIEMVAGPVVSIILMILFLAITTLGGIWAVAGGVGFSVNLITAVYSLMPIETMDGGAIWKWNRVIYLGLFIPMIAFYFFTYMIA